MFAPLGNAATRYRRTGLLVLVTLALVAPACVQPPAPGGAFVDEVVFSGLTQPTAVRFAADGRVFVAEKSGIIKVFDSLTDTTPTVFADLRTEVYSVSRSTHSSRRTRGCTSHTRATRSSAGHHLCGVHPVERAIRVRRRPDPNRMVASPARVSPACRPPAT